MSDDAFVSAFERCTLAEEGFRHPDHVRLAWIYLMRMDLLEAIRTYSQGLKRFATTHGAPQKYHETVTWAFMLLINERLQAEEEGDWPAFAARNPDLLVFRDGAFFDYYPPEVLQSEVARKTFVLPHRADGSPLSNRPSPTPDEGPRT